MRQGRLARFRAGGSSVLGRVRRAEVNIYLVTVTVGGTRFKYFDSLWVNQPNAKERATQLLDEFRRVGIELYGDGSTTNMVGSAWAVTVTPAHCNDGHLADAPKDAA